jgi:tubulin beta
MSAHRKVLLVSVGKGGNRIADAFLERLIRENGVALGGRYDGPNSEGLGVFFDRHVTGSLIPRRILVDVDRSSLRAEQNSVYRPLALDYVVETLDVGPNWAKGYHGSGEVADYAMSAIMTRVEALDGDCVIWVIHTLGGGCGSGLGSLLLDRLADEMPNVPRISVASLPSDTTSASATEPYNAMLALNHVLSAAHQMICIDNQQLFDICFRGSRVSVPTFADLNEVICIALNTLVTPLIWPGADGRRMTLEDFHAGLTLTPDEDATPWHSRAAGDVAPHLKLVSMAAWPLRVRTSSLPAVSDEIAATSMVREQYSLLVPPYGGTWLKMLAVLSGPGATAEAFVRSLPSFAQVVTNQAQNGTNRRAAAAGFHTGVSRSLMDLQVRFDKLTLQKTFFRWYIDEGMDESRFRDADYFVSQVTSALRNIGLESTEDNPAEAE